LVTRQLTVAIDFHCVNKKISCSTKEGRFGMINDDKIDILGELSL